jgi:hypothetical protein
LVRGGNKKFEARQRILSVADADSWMETTRKPNCWGGYFFSFAATI